MRTVHLLVSLSLACACGRAAEPTRLEPLTSEQTDLSLRSVPNTVGELRWQQVHRFPDPALGVVYSYGDGSSPGSDVFVYPRDATSPVTHAELRAHGKPLLETLQTQRSAGRFDAYELLADSIVTIDLGGAPLDGSHIVVLLTRGGEARASHQHIFVLGDEIVKVRTTFAPDEDRTKRMERFIEALLRGMVRGEDEVEA